MPLTDAERKAAAVAALGREPDEVKDHLLQAGMDPADAGMDADVINQPVADPQTAGIVFEEQGIKSWLDDQGYAVSDSDALSAVNNGVANVAKLKYGQSSVNRWINRKLAMGAHRSGNALELAVGALYPLWNGSQQSFFGWQAGESRDEIINRLIGEPVEPGQDEEKPFFSSLQQIRALANASMTGHLDRAALILEQEPRVFESLHNDLSFQDVLIQKSFAGDEDSYNAWLSDIQNAKGGTVAMAALAGAVSGVEAFADPLAIVGEAKVLATPAIKMAQFGAKAGLVRDAKGAIKGLRSFDEIKGLKVEAEIAEQLNPLNRSLGSAYSTQKNAQKLRDSAFAAYEKDRTNPDVMRRYVKAEKRLAEANTGVSRFAQAQAPKDDIYVQKLKTTNPDLLTIQTKGRSVESVRRDVLAAEHATQFEIDAGLKQAGFGNEAQYRRLLSTIQKKIREGAPLNQTDYDAMNAWSQLSSNVQEAIRIKGGGMPEVVRDGAIRQTPVSIEDWTKLDDLPLFNQRSLLGPDDAEAFGDAGRMLTAGAHTADVHVPQAAMPEYLTVGQGKGVPRSAHDGHWVREVTNPHVKTLESVGPDGKKVVFTESAQQHLFDKQLPPGLVGQHPSPSSILERGILPFREPRGALKGTGIYERMRAGQFNYEVAKTGSDEFMERVLLEGGIIEKGKWYAGSRAAYRGTAGKESALRVVKALDADMGSKEHIEAYDALSSAEKKVHANLRQWFDHLAERQSITGGQRINNYWRHLFTEQMFEGGARPVELLGLPVDAELNGSHLLPRLGATGYSMDLLEVLENYNRASHRKIHIEPMLQDLLDLGEYHGGQTNHYVQALVTKLKGMPAPIEMQVDQAAAATAKALGAPVDLPPPTRVAMGVTSLYYGAMIGGNINYLIQNLGTGVLNPLAKFGALNTANAIIQMATPEGRRLADLSGAGTMMSKMFESDAMRTYSDFMSSLGPQQSEFYVRGLAFHAALSDLTKKSGKTLAQMAEEGTLRAALAEAVNASEQVQHIYGINGRSPVVTNIIGNAGASVSTQFLSFPYKQTGFLLSMAQEDPGMVLRYFGYSGVIQRMAANELNIDASQWTGLGYLPMRQPDQSVPLSPGMQALSRMFEWQEAVAKGDPAAVEQSQKLFIDALQAGVPGLAPLKRTAEAADRLNTGYHTNPNSPLGVNEAVRSIDIPSEVLPTVLQTPSMQEHGFRELQSQERQQSQTNLWLIKKYSNQVIDGIVEGDNAKIDEAFQRSSELGVMLSPNVGDAALQAMFMTRQARWFAKNPLYMPDNFHPTERDFRVPVQP